MLSGAHGVKGRCAVVTSLASSNQFQTYPEGDGDEPSGGSDLAGSGIRGEEMVSNVGLCKEMRTVSEHDRWRMRNVPVILLLELLSFQKRKAPFEDPDPGRWRGSCELVVEDFQDVVLHTNNLLNCPRSVQRRCVVGLAPGEESCDRHQPISKWRVCRGT